MKEDKTMVNLVCCVGFVGLFCLVLDIADLIIIFILYIVYKLDGGKMGIVEYFKRMV